MRKLLILIALMAVAPLARAQEGSYTIKSDVQGIDGDSYYLTIWNGTSQTVRKQADLVDGQIDYKDTTSVPLVIRITVANKELYKMAGRGSFPAKSQSIWLVATPGDNIILKGQFSDFSEVYPEGGKENESIVKLTKEYHPIVNDAVNISVTLATKKEELTEAEIQELAAKQKELYKQSDAVMHAYLKENASSIAGLYYMNDMLLRQNITPEFAEEAIRDVASNYTVTPYYETIAQRIEGSKYDVGTTIFNIVSTNTPDGKKFNSSDWKGKFFLIDFWGSWCVPCLEDVPFLKNLRDSHASKLHVLGIASDKEEPWKKAIVENGLDWTQVLNGKDSEDFVARLNVTGFPTKILVAPNGEIVYRTSGGGEESFKKMAKIIDDWK